jgi:hypothetical protein
VGVVPKSWITELPAWAIVNSDDKTITVQTCRQAMTVMEFMPQYEDENWDIVVSSWQESLKLQKAIKRFVN